VSPNIQLRERPALNEHCLKRSDKEEVGIFVCLGVVGKMNESDKSFLLSEFGYLLLEKIGEGAYGVVYSAQDRRSGKLVAIKKIVRAMDRTNSCKRTFRELKFLTTLEHENVIPLQNVIVQDGKVNHDASRVEGREAEFAHKNLFLIFDLMETDLTSIIKSPQTLTNEHCQFFIYQVLRGLKYVHSANIIHRDLKPRNLLVNSNCDLRICDFGLARLDLPELSRKDGACMSDYVATRWYRPPEVVISSGTYTKALDMWAVGCILAELILRKPLFPGSDQYDLLKRICEVLGPPPEDMIAQARNHKVQIYMRNLSYQYPRPTRPLSRLLRGCSPLALDLITKLLVFKPEMRLSIEEAICHPYLSTLYCPSDEPTTSAIDDPVFSFEGHGKPNVHGLRSQLLRLSAKHHRKTAAQIQSLSRTSMTSGDNLEEEEQKTADNGDDEGKHIDDDFDPSTDYAFESERAEESKSTKISNNFSDEKTSNPNKKERRFQRRNGFFRSSSKA